MSFHSTSTALVPVQNQHKEIMAYNEPFYQPQSINPFYPQSYPHNYQHPGFNYMYPQQIPQYYSYQYQQYQEIPRQILTGANPQMFQQNIIGQISPNEKREVLGSNDLSSTSRRNTLDYGEIRKTPQPSENRRVLLPETFNTLNQPSIYNDEDDSSSSDGSINENLRLPRRKQQWRRENNINQIIATSNLKNLAEFGQQILLSKINKVYNKIHI